ncbi:hypothetical protein DSL72_002891 [Monilinia vaccinii-corymbosi]|uniref:2EXR domain-containing protein n=1 Tax=Monilinia vaccinii-corymbosi TaxID=61207 RepID=A0A8A3PE18_9HELO|nr:hypothetical protein DSL72_002891 [Monilinia vaccinii-corymbosi]
MSTSDAGDHSGDAKTFTRFSKLPLELRTMIWSFASFHRRTLPVEVKRLHRLKRAVVGHADDYSLFRFRSDIPIPALFSVCRESRSEAKKHFKRALEAHHTFRHFSLTLLPRFYTNPACDTICPVGFYSVSHHRKLLAGMQQSQLHHIAFDESQLDATLRAAEHPLIMRTWMENIAQPPAPVHSLTLFVGPHPRTPYRAGSRASYADDVGPANWDSLTPAQQCSLCVAISRFTRTVAALRKAVARQMGHDEVRRESRLPREILPSSSRHLLMERLCGDAESLEDWSPPRLELLVHRVPAWVGKLLRSDRLEDFYRCWDGLCKPCYGSGGFVV